ncbi:MAG TPA: Spy/CpxP family protein refolding chaperone [Rhizomicrobium sp.]|jgi:hypothetical protein|nr:Spy/CpxP family protein refolding chaperone [Rhizomicrobium sp.]
MKKFIIPLLATTLLAGGIAVAATAPRPDMPGKDDLQRHRAQMCSDMYAHEVGQLAFLETKLSLSPAQTGAFNAWKGVKLLEAKEHSAKCSTMVMPDRDHPPSPLDHMAREEQMLKARLASLQTERPALTTLYNALNDTQKKEFAMAGMRMHGGPIHHGWFGHGPGGRMGDHGGPMGGHGPDGGPGMMRDHDGDGPPPPPPGDGE